MSTFDGNLLWVHGWGSGIGVWEPVLERLPGYHHRCLDYGLAGQVSTWRHALAAAIDSRTVVIGWSMGGMLALEQASRAKGLVLIGSTLRFVSEKSREGVPPRVLARMQKRLKTNPEETLRIFAEGMFTAAEAAQGAIQDHAARAWRGKGLAGSAFSVDGLDAGLQFLAASDLRETARSLSIPMRWLHGTADPICPPGGQKHGPVRWLEQAGHAPQLTQPDNVAQYIEEFCGDCECR